MNIKLLRSFSLLKKALFLAVPLLASASIAHAVPIFAPGDTIYGGALSGGSFAVGVAGTFPGVNNWPAGESPDHAIDGVGQKYLNFYKENSGLVVTPSFGPSIATSLQLWTANDAIARDPASYQLYGANVALGSGPFALADFTLISAGLLALPDTRNAGGTSPLNDANSQTITFANSASYSSYMIVFPTVKTPTGANSMQIGEVQLFGSRAGNPVPDHGTTMALLGLALAGLAAVRRKLA